MDDERRPARTRAEPQLKPPPPDRPMPPPPERPEPETDELDDEVVPDGRFEPL